LGLGLTLPSPKERVLGRVMFKSSPLERIIHEMNAFLKAFMRATQFR